MTLFRSNVRRHRKGKKNERKITEKDKNEKNNRKNKKYVKKLRKTVFFGSTNMGQTEQESGNLTSLFLIFCQQKKKTNSVKKKIRLFKNNLKKITISLKTSGKIEFI